MILEDIAKTPGRLPVVLDTDAYNEVDDPFALAYLALSPERVELLAVSAAPYSNEQTAPADGMRKSFDEVHRVLSDIPEVRPSVWRGSEKFMSGPSEPIESEAAHEIIRLSRERSGLVVVAIGAVTNVASALLLDRDLASRISVVWLGGNSLEWPTAAEYNLSQDQHAARVVFDSGVPLLHVPCYPVSSHLLITLVELREVLSDGPLGRYLLERVEEHMRGDAIRAKEIWDLAPAAWVVDASRVPTYRAPAPKLREDQTWDCTDRSRHEILVARMVDRNAIFADVYRKLRGR